MAEENNNPTPNTEENIESNPTSTSGGSNNKNGGLIATIIILSILLVVAIFLALFFGLRNNSSDDNTVTPDPEIVEPGPVEDPNDGGNEGEPTHIHSSGSYGYLIDEYTDNDTPMGLVEYTCDECGLPYIETRELYFASDSWETISEYSSNGLAEERYCLGETRELEMGEGIDDKAEDFDPSNPIVIEPETIHVRIIDFNHDDLTDDESDYNNGSNKAAITVETVETLSTSYVFNCITEASSVGGWDGSTMRSRLQPESEENNGSYAGTIYDMLPDEVKPYIKTVDKNATAGNLSTDIITSSDQLFLLSVSELYSVEGITNSSWEIVSNKSEALCNEGTQYAYYEWKVEDHDPNITYGDPLLKNKKDATRRSYWWLRSPGLGNNNWYFFCISNTGSLYLNQARFDIPQGVSFAFCI